MTTAELFKILEEEREKKKSNKRWVCVGTEGWEGGKWIVDVPLISYLCYNHAREGNYDQSLLEDFMIELLEDKYGENETSGAADYIVKMAQLDGANIAKLQDAVIKHGCSYKLCEFAKEVRCCNKKLLEKPFFDRISKYDDFNEYTYENICEFVEVCGTDISIYEDQIINSIRKTIEKIAKDLEKEKKKDKYYRDIRMIDWLERKIDRTAHFLYKLTEDFKNINRDKLRNALIELGCFSTILTYAKNIEGESIEKFIDDVSKKHGSNGIMAFADAANYYGLSKHLKDNIDKFQDAIIATNDIDSIGEFTEFEHSGVDRRKLEAVIFANATGEQLNNYYDKHMNKYETHDHGMTYSRRKSDYEALCLAAIRTEHQELINKILKDLKERPELISIEVLNECVQDVKKLVKKSKSFDSRIILYFLKNEKINKKDKDELVAAIIESAKKYTTAKQVKEFIVLNVRQKEIEDIVCEIGAPEDIYDIAMKKYKEKDLNKLTEVIIARGDAKWIFTFAAKVKGLDDEKDLPRLTNAIIACSDAEWISTFAVNIKGLNDIERLKLMKIAIELVEKYGESQAGFAKRIRFKSKNEKSGE